MAFQDQTQKPAASQGDPSSWSGVYYDGSAEKEILDWRKIFTDNAKDQSPEARKQVALERFGMMWAVARNEPNDTQYLWEFELGISAAICLVAAFGKGAAPLLFSRLPSVPRGSMQVGIARALVYIGAGGTAISFLTDEMKAKPEKRLDNTALIIGIRREMEKHGLRAAGASPGGVQIDSLGLKRFPARITAAKRNGSIAIPANKIGVLA